MSTKENFNKAMYDMFGVGKDGEAAEFEGTYDEEVSIEPANVAVSRPAPAQGTYIAPGVYIEGNITAKGDVEIAGELKGDIAAEGCVTIRSNVVGNINASKLVLSDCCVTGDVNSTSDVVITDKSIVTGNIKAKSLTCSGRVNGNIDVEENLVIDHKACIVGDIATSTMTVERGAVIKGTLQMRIGE